MSKSIALGLLGAGAILLAILLTGCSDAPSPTPSAGDGPTPTGTAQPGVTPAPTPAGAALTLGVYLTLCAPTEQDLADDATFGDFSSVLGAELDRLEPLTPPAELSEWHSQYVESFRKVQDILDTQPKDDVMDFAGLILIAAVSADLEEKLGEVSARLPEDVRQQMIEASCIDREDLPENYETVPDDHGNNLESATRIAIGEAVAIEFEDPDDKELFVFLVEPGAEYVFTLHWESWNRWSYPSRPIMALFDAGGYELARLEDSNFSSNSNRSNKMMWQAVTGGDYYIAVGDGATFGSFTLTVTDGEAAEPLDRDDHGNSEGDATAIRVGTDARGALDYDGDIDFFRFQAERGQSYQIDVALGTLDDSIVDLYDVDWSFLDSNDDYGDTFASRLSWEAPSSGERYVLVGGYGTGTYTLTVSLSDLIDDHGNSEGDATAIRVGTDVRGAVDYDDDIDFFRFQAERGQTYRIDVALGTLDDSIVDLYDTDGSFLDTNDDYGDTYASRLSWEAPSSGERYVLVGGAYTSSQGTYTLTVSLIIDDHANSEGGATAIRAGAGVRGVLDYDGDIDYFRFQAEQGKFYQIDVALGTLDDSQLVLLGPDDWELAYNDDHGNTYASRLSWEAPSSGERYVAVEGYGVGTYTLTVVIVDDHGNDFESATRLVIGEAVSLELENDDDIDVLVFRARPGTVYVLTLDWEYYSFRESSTERPLLAVYSSNGQEHTRLMGYDFSRISVPSIDLQWQALTGGDYYIVIGDGNTEGAGAFYVAGGKATEQLDRDDHSDTPDNARNAGNTSYDTDGDGLIEVSNLTQLNAIRWDLDGDGSPSSNATGYNAAFPNAVAGMGCPDSGCSGYELISDLDFDTNGNGRADAGDAYWNDGEGWVPIGDDFEAAFKTFFNGGGHTISNLYIDRRDAKYAGLFGNTGFSGSNSWVGLNNNIGGLALVNVDVQGGTYSGGLAGSNGLVIVACSVTGVVGGGGDVGGLVGNNFSGTVIASYSAASVADGSDTGGLVGSNFSGTIIASYSIGSVSDYNGVGGLVGSNFADRGTARDSYWDTQTSGQSESAGGEGRTTSELQSPTGYTGIYENWNVDLDEDGVGDDLWDFGNASQYPTLRHGS